MQFKIIYLLTYLLTCFAYIFPEIDAAIFQTCIACMCGLLWSKHKYRPFFMAFRPLHIVCTYTPCKWPTGLSLSNYTATTATMIQNLDSLLIIVWCFVVHTYMWGICHFLFKESSFGIKSKDYQLRCKNWEKLRMIV